MNANVDRIMVISSVLDIVSLLESKVCQTYEEQLLLQIESHVCSG